MTELYSRIRGMMSGPLGVVPASLVVLPLTLSYKTYEILAPGIGGATVQKALVVVAILIAVALLGFRSPPWPVWVIGSSIGVGYIIGLITQARGVDGFDTEMLLGAAGLVYPWLLFFIDWRTVRSAWLSAVLGGLAPFTVLLSSILQFIEPLGITMIRHEYTGALRLEAGMPPAYLAGLSLVGVAGGMWMWVQRRWMGFALAIVNAGICGLTGSRLATVAAGVIFLGTVIAAVIQGYPFAKTSAVLTGLAAVGAGIVLLPNFLARVNGTHGGLFEGTGRDQAWTYFWTRLLEWPWTGFGPGSPPMLSEESPNWVVRESFVSPHNSYLTLAVDIGIPLTVTYVAGLIALFVVIFRDSPIPQRVLVVLVAVACLGYGIADNLLTAPQSAVMFVAFLAFLYTYRYGERKAPFRDDPVGDRTLP